ncbi:Nse1 non-SMC component of SMC5-6 complex-domain-containing protein [Hypoxylon trugodes]|uniref:Nse1 non-SMC component of SMC5-6 complex-domain-containing protein n=1 Tax=Hypoxylon trugodes TaxID=326681 RepID=UPI0021951F46|nr:Nse1 non-SMC component of SMC5-6 complex-domain-containing protein [Hypoxylon trugodes]KAI1383126.1 Nse1 non-SMC component of SMC5-6 complex-domain-containing protein [Hypoxylon trugodes]
MEDDDIPNHYDDGNRAFLQAFLARGTLTFAQAQPILAAIFTAHDKIEYQHRQESRRNRVSRREDDEESDNEEPEVTQPAQVTREDFNSYVSAASEKLSPFDMEIRGITHQGSGERIFCLVNTTSDPLTRLATLRTGEEIVFVRRVIDAMFDKYNTPRMELMCLDFMQANKLRSAPREEETESPENGEGGDGEEGQQTQMVGGLKGLKSSEVEHVMQGLVDEGWVERSRAGFYSLAPRALAELRSWLVDAYNEPPDPDADEEDNAGQWQRIKFCEACREIVTSGQRCAERDCNVRLHDHCADTFWRMRRENTGQREKKCSRCEKEWTGRHFVGERAVTETEAYQRGRRRSGRPSGGGRSSLAERIVEEDEDEDEEEE